jgi:porin
MLPREVAIILLACSLLTSPEVSWADCGSEEPACCSPCLWNREKLTGDWWGYRSRVAEHGINVDVEATQFYQGVASGGANETFRYGGKADYFLTYSGQQAGLSGLGQGLIVQLHAETRFGDDINGDAVALAPSNANMLFPNAKQSTAITGLQITQALSEEWAVSFGKFNSLDLFQQLYPQSGRGIDNFMNASLILPLNLGRTVPLSFLGAGILKLNEGRMQGALLVYDSNNITTTAGFDELFNNGANLLGLWRFFTNFGNRPGSHALLGTYATGDFTSLDPLDWAFFPGQGLVADEVRGSWSATYVLEQQLWADPCTPSRNLGLIGVIGFGSRENNPFATTFHIKCEGDGLLACRPKDRIGVGYFYSGLSDNFKALLSRFTIGDFQGGEIYYNAEINPWFHLTLDYQVVEPALGANDTAHVLGLRANIDF